jgi:hypothetical protein
MHRLPGQMKKMSTATEQIGKTIAQHLNLAVIAAMERTASQAQNPGIQKPRSTNKRLSFSHIMLL